MTLSAINIQKLHSDENINLKTSSFWVLNKIHINNNWSQTAQIYPWCSGSGTLIDPYVIENVIINARNSGSCILIENSISDYFIIRNCTLLNSSQGSSDKEAGIKLVNTQKGQIISNNCTLNQGNGIFLKNSDNNFIISNHISNNNATAGATIAGIFLQGSDNNTIHSNTILNNTNYGIFLYIDSNSNKITNNTIINHFYYAIMIYSSNNNDIISNNASGTTIDAIVLYSDSHDNKVEKNNVYENSGRGISLRYRTASNFLTNNTIYDNKVHDNKQGILAHNSYNNTIKSNEIFDNDDGIKIEKSNGTIVYDNYVYNNYYGIYLNSESMNNTIYFNILKNNTYNGWDDGINNNWDNGSIGNYWDDYTGADLDKDGIGDTPYNVSGSAGSKDNYPFINDGPPSIKIISPVNSSFYNHPPNVHVSISDNNGINSTWYSIIGINDNKPFTGNSFTIDSILWNSAGEGNLIIRIHANDSLGYLGHKDHLIIKDTVKPTIIINSPSEGEIFGENAPIFNLTITDIHLEDHVGYYLSDSPIPFLVQVVSGVNIIHINESEWDALPEGNVSIRFSMTDKAGNINEVTITVIKQLSSGTSQPAIPGYNLVIIFSSIAIFSIIIKKRKFF